MPCELQEPRPKLVRVQNSLQRIFSNTLSQDEAAEQKKEKINSSLEQYSEGI